MEKKILVRGAIILGIAIAIILVLVGIETLSKKETTPVLSNADDVYLTVDGIEITYGELWNKMRNIEGANYIEDYVLEYLLSDELDNVTQQEIDDEVKLRKYYTVNDEDIAKIMEDEDIHQDYIDAFNSTVISRGYNPEDPDSLADYVRLDIAKRNYTKNLINTAEEGNKNYVSDEDVAIYYDENTYGDICTLDLRFSNSTEVTTVFESLDLVLNYEGGIGEYIGQLNIEDILAFNSTNTIELDSNSVFPFFVKMYNLTNPWEEQLPENITKEEYCTNYSDLAMKNYDDMTDGKASAHPLVELADYLFNTLNSNQNGTPYTYTNTKTFGDFTILSFKVSEEERTAYSALSVAEKDEIRAEVVAARANDTAITDAMEDLIYLTELEILDPNMKLVYGFNKNVEFDNNGSETLVAKTEDIEITVDDYFAYLEETMGVFYSVEMAKQKLLLESEEYTTLYGESRDYFNSSNEDMKQHVADLDDMKARFGTNQYATYGYSSTTMTWDEFLRLAFTMESEKELLENMFIIPSIQLEVMQDQIDYADAVNYMQDQIDRYYSLNVNHVLIYFDFDFDFEPDNFEDYMVSLSTEDQNELNLLLVAFRDLIKEKVIDDELTFDAIIEEYTKTLLTDETSEWAQFKQAGFFIKTEALGEIDQTTGTGLDSAFADSLKRIYDVMVDLEETSYDDDQVTISQFGVHYISVTQGANFEQFSAKYEDTENTGDPENDNVIPNRDQVELYAQIQYASAKGENTTLMFNDSDVYAALDYYYGPIYQSYLSSSAFNAYLGQYIVDNGTYGANNTDQMAKLQTLVDTLNKVNYPELFGTE